LNFLHFPYEEAKTTGVNAHPTSWTEEKAGLWTKEKAGLSFEI
jgi:hypothetical protein